MYDFLDKIGLKAVLEVIKGKMPTSLPANGGNADYAAVARDAQLFNGKPSDNYVQFRGVIQVDDMSAVPADVYEYVNDSTYKVAYEVAISPLVSEFVGLPHIWWLIKYYVYGYGNGFSCQTAFPVGFGGVPYIRYSQEGVWSDWKEISTTPIKKMTFPSVATNAGGGGSLFSADFGTPITIACTSRGNTQCTPFYYRDRNQWLLLAKDATTLDPIPAGTYSFDVWYI